MLQIITKKNQKCKNRKKLENSAQIFEKTLFFRRKNHNFEGSGGRSWEQKSVKNQKRMLTCEGILASIFFDFDGFWRPSWTQVGSKIDSKRVREAFQEAPRVVLGASWGSPGAKRPSRGSQKWQHKFFIYFYIGFNSILYILYIFI